MKEYAKKFYNSKAWERARAYVMARDLGLCQECRKKGRYRSGDTVHHIIHLTPENINDPAITLNPDNLETICRDCHAEVHQKPKGYRFTLDEFGDVEISDDEMN